MADDFMVRAMAQLRNIESECAAVATKIEKLNESSVEASAQELKLVADRALVAEEHRAELDSRIANLEAQIASARSRFDDQERISSDNHGASIAELRKGLKDLDAERDEAVARLQLLRSSFKDHFHGLGVCDDRSRHTASPEPIHTAAVAPHVGVRLDDLAASDERPRNRRDSATPDSSTLSSSLSAIGDYSDDEFDYPAEDDLDDEFVSDNEFIPTKAPQKRRRNKAMAYTDVERICRFNKNHYPLAVIIDGLPYHISCDVCNANDMSTPRGLQRHYMKTSCVPGTITFEKTISRCTKQLISPDDALLIEQGMEPTKKADTRTYIGAKSSNRLGPGNGNLDSMYSPTPSDGRPIDVDVGDNGNILVAGGPSQSPAPTATMACLVPRRTRTDPKRSKKFREAAVLVESGSDLPDARSPIPNHDTMSTISRTSRFTRESENLLAPPNNMTADRGSKRRLSETSVSSGPPTGNIAPTAIMFGTSFVLTPGLVDSLGHPTLPHLKKRRETSQESDTTMFTPGDHESLIVTLRMPT